MSEDRLWRYIRDGMGPLWEPQRIEYRLTAGIPDVAYSITRHGWLELKYLPKKPTRGLLKIPHLTDDQRNWAAAHGSRSGLCFILLQVEDSYMLFDWTKSYMVGRLSYEDHTKIATRFWFKRIHWRELRDALVSPVVRFRTPVYVDRQ
jgi:hypothetical protein